ncbi:MAG TPA: hypothetical protein VFV46_08790 [Lacibacter sp.]|nr:hypothetical protein [Lacibacter sp.]
MAVCAAVLCVQTLLLLNEGTGDFLLAGFVFAATLFSYNLHFFLASAKSDASEQLSWFRKTYKLTVYVIIAAMVAALSLFLYLKDIRYFVIAAVLLNASYTAPLLLKKSLKLPLLLTFVKSYFVGFTWAFATVVLPLVIIQKQPAIAEVAVFFHRFMLVSIATLLFDYRDRSRDLQWGVRTPANMLNAKQYDLFYGVNILLFTLSAGLLMAAVPSPWQWLQVLPCIYLWWLYRVSKKRTDDLFYLSWVDGSLFLSAILSLFLLI